MMDALVLAISAGFGAVLSTAIFIVVTILRVRNALRPGDGVLGEHVYELRDDGLHEQTSVNETLSSWTGIKSVDETRGYAFIGMQNGTFHVIPRSAFNSDEHANIFLSELKRRAKGSA